MARLRPIAALLPLLLLAGCFQLRALIRVNEDGAGTLEETVLVSGMVRQMMQEADSSLAAQPLYDMDSLRAHASRLGAGVRLLRVDSVEDGEDFGYRAVYAFDDLATLRFRFNPNIMPSRGAGRAGRGSSALLAGTSPELPVTFARDADGAIRVRMPQPAPGAPAAPLDRAQVTALSDSLRRQMGSAGAAVSEMLDGMRLRLALRGPGSVTATDASFPEDSSVVLFDYSLGSFVGLMREKPELVARAQLLDRAGTPDTRPLMRALAARPDVRYELLPEVTVRFER